MDKKRKLFGTDGIRGLSNQYPMDSQTAMLAGMAAGFYFKEGGHRHKVVIGKDTRLSSYMIENALTSGFLSMGMDVVLVGPMPTPAISMITKAFRADLGVMISASHNPFYDNGIKFFNAKGLKLSDEVEAEIEKLIESEISDKNLSKYLEKPENLGRAKRLDDAAGRYIEYVKNTFPKSLSLEGLKIVVDCANGATYKIAPIVFWELGAEIISIGVEPNGFNINEKCGSTDVSRLIQKTLEEKADIGIALDGDGDRLIVCDEKGQIIDGDQIIAAIATHLNDRNKLEGGGVVATQMSNMGFEQYLKNHDIGVFRTKVGDRYVIQEMLKRGCNLGGEQSGHVIFNDFITTGDGIIASLQLLAILVEQKQDKKLASEVLRIFQPFPQILRNICYEQNAKPDLQNKKFKELVESFSQELSDNGRILIRESGTEPIIRIMVEGKDKKHIEKIANTLEANL